MCQLGQKETTSQDQAPRGPGDPARGQERIPRAEQGLNVAGNEVGYGRRAFHLQHSRYCVPAYSWGQQSARRWGKSHRTPLPSKAQALESVYNLLGRQGPLWVRSHWTTEGSSGSSRRAAQGAHTGCSQGAHGTAQGRALKNSPGEEPSPKAEEKQQDWGWEEFREQWGEQEGR